MRGNQTSYYEVINTLSDEIISYAEIWPSILHKILVDDEYSFYRKKRNIINL